MMLPSSYKLTKLSNLKDEQLNELIRLHKISIPNSSFSAQKNELCKKIYRSISSDEKFFNLVVISNGRPLGLFLGRVGVVPFKNLMSFYDYCIYFWRIFSRQKFNFFPKVFEVVCLSLLKYSKKRKCWIELIYIDKTLQNKGVGTEMLKIYLKSLPRSTHIWVDTERKNKAAVNFYEKNNFIRHHPISLKNTILLYKKI